MATIQSLTQTCLLKFGQAPDNLRFNDDFYEAINDSQNEIANSRCWGFLKTTINLTTVADTRTVALPTDFGKPYPYRGALRITTTGYLGDIIQLMTQDEWYNNDYDDGSSTGEPTLAYIMGSSLYLSPIPDAVYTIAMIYYKRPTEIEDTSDTITIPTAYHELLKKKIFRRLQDAGYSSQQELAISDSDIAKLESEAARDDIAKYGSAPFNLNSTTYRRRTI